MGVEVSGGHEGEDRVVRHRLGHATSLIILIAWLGFDCVEPVAISVGVVERFLLQTSMVIG